MRCPPLAGRPWVVAFFALLLAGGAFGARGKKPVNTPVDEVPAHPRLVVVAVHSWAGSSQSLVAAALDLLQGSALFAKERSTILWYEEPPGSGRHHVVGAYALKSAASVAQIGGFLRDLERRFDDRDVPDAARLLQTDLLWIENAPVDAPGLKLPSPKILGTPWGVEALMGAASDWFVDACEEHREDARLCHAVEKASERDDKTAVFETKPDMWIGGEYKNGALECWAYANARDEEILGAAGDALLVGEVARSRLESQGPDASRHLVEGAVSSVVARRADELFPLDVAASGAIEDKVSAWVAAIARAVVDQRILARRAVVFALEPNAIRGAIVGARLPQGAAAAPFAPVSGVEVVEGGRAPREPRAFTVTLRTTPKIAKK